MFPRDSILSISSCFEISINSSPPKRPNNAFSSLMHEDMILTKSLRTSSPNKCPYVSLIFLKKSMSIIITERNE